MFSYDRGRYFNKAVQGNMPTPLRNLYIKFYVNRLRHCGEMAHVEEIYILLETLTSLPAECCSFLEPPGFLEHLGRTHYHLSILCIQAVATDFVPSSIVAITGPSS